MKVALCTPVHDTTKTGFTSSLFALQASSPHNLSWHMLHRNSWLAEAREVIAQSALEWGAEWLLWLDADQTFPPDTLDRLLAHDKPFVGANYRKKLADRVESVAQKDGRGIEPKREGLEPVDILGFGVTLTKAGMFSAMPRPWFRMGAHGEDGWFCEQAIKAGFQPCVDHSLRVGHVTEVVLHF